MRRNGRGGGWERCTPAHASVARCALAIAERGEVESLGCVWVTQTLVVERAIRPCWRSREPGRV